MIIPLHYLPKFYDKVATESFHNVRVSLIVMTVDCLRLFTQSAQLIGLLWLELARDDSPAFTEQNSLAVCQKFWSARQKNYSAEWPLSFFAGLTEFKLAVAVKGSPKFSLQVRWECKICQTHSKVIYYYHYYNIINITSLGDGQNLIGQERRCLFDMFSCTFLGFFWPKLH